MGQKRILLRAVEPVDLIDEKDRALSETAPVASLLEDLPQILHARENRRKLLKMKPRTARHEPRDRRLACAGRAPEDHRAQAFACGNPVKGAALAKEMI